MVQNHFMFGLQPKVYHHILQSRPVASYEEALAIAQNFELAELKASQGFAASLYSNPAPSVCQQHLASTTIYGARD